MKFARYLEDNAVVEWRKAYINYRGLKKLIKQVHARHLARTSLALTRATPTNSSLGGLRRRGVIRSVSGGSVAARTPDGEYGTFGDSGTPGDERGPDARKLPAIDLKGTGLRLPEQQSRDSGELTAAESDDTRVPCSSGESAQAKAAFDLEAQSADGPRRPQRSHVRQHAKQHPRPALQGRQAESSRTQPAEDHEGEASAPHEPKAKKKKHKKGGKKGQHHVTLDQLVQQNFDAEEQKFFGALDVEIERVHDFFQAREREAHAKLELLAQQLRELAEHRREYKARQPPAVVKLNTGLSRMGMRLPPVPLLGGKKRGQEASEGTAAQPQSSTGKSSPHSDPAHAQGEDSPPTVEGDEGDRRRSLALKRMLETGHYDSHDEAEAREAIRAAAMSHDPQRYIAARKKLKAAVLEYYRGLELLKNYRVLNRVGFGKVLKKFEKATGVAGINDAWFHAKVSPSFLVTSESVEKLIEGTEEIYTAYFEHGDRKKALQRLRMTAGPEHHSHHMSVARAGFYVGVTLCAVVGGIVEAMKQHNGSRTDIPAWRELLRLYGAFFIGSLFALLFGFNLAIWHAARINATFIFEWDVRTTMDYQEYYELPAFLLLLLSVFFWVSFVNPFPSSIAPTTWPLVWLVIVVLIMMDPLPVNLRPSRRWFVSSILRVFGAGLIAGVEFRDFFLGDELNSLAWPISNLWFMGCSYHNHWTPGVCEPNGTFWTAALQSVPAFLRFGQCLRRFEDSKRTAWLHIANACKYAAAIFYYWFYINYRYHGSQNRELILFAFFATLYSLATSAWDLTMDWSLLRPRARWPLLRDELLFAPPCYYVAIVTNVMLRFTWVIYLPGVGGPASLTLKAFLIALLEMLRRCQWNIYRLENEHLGNVDQYRSTREVPLPYRFQKPTADDEEDGVELGKPSSSRLPMLRRQSAKTPAADTEDSESDDEVEQAMRPPLAGAPADGASPRSKRGFLKRLQGRLVPDAGGDRSLGSKLADQAAAHGAVARDYQPRALEPDGGLDSSDEEARSGRPSDI